MATPSAKPGATPTHLTSSPHPSSAPLSRSMAHKSPSMRTPTASGPGLNQPPSTSSHQYTTPLATTSAVDDPVNFSSPSALLALGGYAGISPSPAVHDSLVGTSMNENDIQNLGMQGLKLGVARDSDEEQRHRIEEVVRSLRTRVAGRGVSRDGIERLSRLEGLERLWQDDNINIAGNFVDLEIEFHAGNDVVKEVNLQYATAEHTDGGRREAATLVLKRNLIQSLQDADSGKWRSLGPFYKNLQWLAKLDKLSQEVNCFEALEGLEDNLKRIWAEENKDGQHGGDHEHLCNGVIGRPTMHKGTRVGLGLEYWIEQAKLLDSKNIATSADSMAIDHPQETDPEVEDQQKAWTVMIECEEGYPSLRISKEWVGNEIFGPRERSESLPSIGSAESVNWLEPPRTMRLPHGDHPDSMALDSNMLGHSPPNRRFVAKLEPPLDIPILAASNIHQHLGMQLPQDFKMVTYDGLLVPGPATDSSAQFGRRKHKSSIEAPDSTGNPCTKSHTYTFQAFESVTGRTISELPFSHPRQLAEILPKPEPPKTVSFKSSIPADPISELLSQNDGLTILSNEDPNEDRLNFLLGDGLESGTDCATNGQSSDPTDDGIKVDITLRTQLGQAPAVMLFITDSTKTTDQTQHDDPLISICFEVGLNGRISTVDSSGLVQGKTQHYNGDSEMHGADDSGSEWELQNIHKRISRVLEISQDIGILVEWVLRWQRQRAVSG
ncbi:hypothetical protein N7509_006904 [Penicillium cosmopolitanum]|uniref:Mediator of RNA polymerase II transcription subunit 1 n=1 Tax=Penicillium cosmopolitanum TaxID=1131564 RepID=A0A9X0B7W2_9EURO|nr:uncharacterized protein N7509_006904 [Penicillium cosmopolitanum]KAJ5391414.1 hypothetical protein N7509_006904 [Penicillium cosmopolitanum]